MNQFKDLITGREFAHRGLHNQHVDENSLEAFSLAMNEDLGIELDVHLTSDGYIVVNHDANLVRTTGTDLVIEKAPLEEIRKSRLLKTNTQIPLLKEVLDLVNGKVPLLIELKIEGEIPPLFVDKVLDIINEYPHKNKILLQSFNPYVVKDIKNKVSELPVGQLMSDVLDGQSKFVHFMFKSLLILKLSKPDFFNYEVKYIKKRRIQRKRNKLPLITWTIDNYDKLTTAKHFADNYIFELINIREK